MQTNRAQLQGIRDLVAGKKIVAGPPGPGMTPNQWMAGYARAYGADPDKYRKPLLDFLDWQLEVSYWSHAASEEIGTGSHCAIFYGGMDAILYFAMRNADALVLNAIIRVIGAGIALESMCATPDGMIVIPGARCWISDSTSPDGGDADQRGIRDLRWAYWQGHKIRTPKTLDTALDWTGLWALMQLDNAAKAGATWARDWSSIKERIRTWKDLPPSRNGLTIERWKSGHRAWFAHTRGMLRPAEWAVVDYTTGGEDYGCLPWWPKGYVGGALTIPVPLIEGDGWMSSSTIKLPGNVS